MLRCKTSLKELLFKMVAPIITSGYGFDTHLVPTAGYGGYLYYKPTGLSAGGSEIIKRMIVKRQEFPVYSPISKDLEFVKTLTIPHSHSSISKKYIKIPFVWSIPFYLQTARTNSFEKEINIPFVMSYDVTIPIKNTKILDILRNI